MAQTLGQDHIIFKVAMTRYHAASRCQAALTVLGVATLELVDPTAGIHNLVLTGVKRVRLAGNIHFHQWVFVTIFPLDGFFGVYGGAGQESEIAGYVLKYHFTIVGMNAGLHDLPEFVGKDINYDALSESIQVLERKHLSLQPESSAYMEHNPSSSSSNFSG